MLFFFLNVKKWHPKIGDVVFARQNMLVTIFSTKSSRFGMLITFLYQLFTGKFGDFCRSRQNVRTGLVAKIWASLAIVVLKVVASCALAVDHGG